MEVEPFEVDDTSLWLLITTRSRPKHKCSDEGSYGPLFFVMRLRKHLIKFTSEGSHIVLEIINVQFGKSKYLDGEDAPSCIKCYD